MRNSFFVIFPFTSVLGAIADVYDGVTQASSLQHASYSILTHATALSLLDWSTNKHDLDCILFPTRGIDYCPGYVASYGTKFRFYRVFCFM
jgi:hypothetical protein